MEIKIYTDGASRGNPGKAAVGVIIYDLDGQILKKDNEYIGVTTNNVAEYKAVIRGLELAVGLGASGVKLYADSQLLVKQLSGEYRVKNEGLKPLYENVKALTRNFKNFAAIHIPREQNKEADKLANMALDSQ
ncbi:ribonuclease HI family protein [Desulfitibacter alkalitolerans]|uniref:ribonuclease HI family protein n=1 Tax=Desulfitibacter alkalitolerans TaxID=264641 RepID=UPI0004832B32|nr:ribonuclease HI family protein [Desulfitibacter alkalitolerans]